MFAVSQLLVASLCIYQTQSLPIPETNLQKFPANEYEYSCQRDKLLENEENYEGHNTTLDDDEKIVSHYLEYLKWREFMLTEASGFPPSRPIEEEIDHIRSSELYRALKKLPKGGNMHSHEGHELSKRKILEILFASEDFEYLWMSPESRRYCTVEVDGLDYFNDPASAPEGWVKVKNTRCTLDDLLRGQTLISLLSSTAKRYPTDSAERWNLMDKLWGRLPGKKVLQNVNIKRRYLEAVYNQSLDEGVIYYESRRGFSGKPLYVINSTGKYFLSPERDPNEVDVEETMKVAAAFSKSHTEFLGHKYIASSKRIKTESAFLGDSVISARLHAKLPSQVLGFDAVGQEDAGNSLLFHVDTLLRDYGKLPLYLHNMETSWPDDLITSRNRKDPVGSLNNGIDMLLLHSKRIGHGTGMIKHPYLVELVRQRNISVEICTISSQILGFVPDLRQHPGLHYFRAGIPVVLGADDPGTMGYDDFTVDWFEVYNAWGLDLGDLKKLALNSLWYSGMTADEKHDAVYNHFLPMWSRYVAAMKIEACDRNYAADQSAVPLFIFGSILPREGTNAGPTTVHVYGRNFESAICKRPKCRFGKAAVDATYVDSNHLICETQSPPGITELTVPVYVALDGVNFVDIGEQFTYKYPLCKWEPSPSPSPSPPPSPSPSLSPSPSPSPSPRPASSSVRWHVPANTLFLMIYAGREFI